MNNKHFTLALIIIVLAFSNSLKIIAKNPLDILGLDENATDNEIKKQYRKLQTQFHTDKGGNTERSADINNAYHDLIRNGRKECANKKINDICICPNDIYILDPKDQQKQPQQSLCIQGFTNSSIRCNCPLSDGTRQNQYIPQNSDNCFYRSQPCTCSNSGQSGTCDSGPIKPGLYCQCPQQNQQSSSSKQTPPQDECENRSFGSTDSCTCPQTNNKGTCHYNWTTHKDECKCSDDVCENNSINDGKPCNCPNGNKGTCDYDGSDGVNRCQCSDDECENNRANWGKPCHCSDSGKEGTCGLGRMQNDNLGYKCNCQNQQTRSSFTSFDNNNTFDSTLPPDPIKEYDSAVLYSTNITAPIYNLPLQRTTTPTSNCRDWWFSVTPFTQQVGSMHIDTTDNGRFDIKNTEAGLLINFGYYAPWWYIRFLSSLAGTKTTVNGTMHSEEGSKFRFGLLDSLFAIGLRTDPDAGWKLNGELFIGASDQRVKEVLQKHVANMPNVATGIQGNFDYVVSENCSNKYELSMLSRFTYFTPIKITLSEALNKHEFGTAHYTPGAFIDLFFGFKQCYKCNGQLFFDIGYNPTFHVMSMSPRLELNDSRAQMNIFTEKIPAVRHTIYTTYGYNWDAGNIPMTINIGGTATFCSEISAYGTFFATYGLGF